MGAGVCDGTPRAPVFLQLRDCGGLREVEVTACLVWKDWPHRVHPHSLVGKDCTDGVCRVRLRPHIAIVFKTPPYEDLEIVEPVTVNVFLQRLTDGVCSEPLPFTYLPRDHDSYGVDKKRKRGLPDVLGELNSSDPHGIESKRRRKKPVFLDQFLPSHGSGPYLPPSVLLPDTDFFPGTVSLPSLEPPGGPDLLDDGFPYDPAAPTLLTMLDMLPPAPPLTSAVAGNGGAGAAVGEPPGPEPLTLDSYQAPGPGDGGTASLVGSNMFPNQYREAGFGGGLLSPGPEAT
ncbi:hypothetical protein Celaphus_00004599 [Cervus elaphus hippelaphus]|uniref:RHD domain-containing protein n=1 Tax=Cervus elaphus hippelaphus TaxID=46360 RepID=A0A212DBH6_CEREH|nr:hypothetical protein Celaphus_00004599 [Cervus elaphus hippelaphus]